VLTIKFEAGRRTFELEAARGHGFVKLTGDGEVFYSATYGRHFGRRWTWSRCPSRRPVKPAGEGLA
jgi:hypothetical protein